MAPFGLFNEPKNIIELFTFDLNTFFVEDDYEEISCVEEEGVFMIEYEKVLPWTELGLFNAVVFRVFNDKKNIIGSNHINVRFVAELNIENSSHVIKFINKLHRIYGADDQNSDELETKEQGASYETLSRQWTLGEGKYIYSVTLKVRNGELLLEILFFNHLLELLKN